MNYTEVRVVLVVGYGAGGWRAESLLLSQRSTGAVVSLEFQSRPMTVPEVGSVGKKGTRGKICLKKRARPGEWCRFRVAVLDEIAVGEMPGSYIRRPKAAIKIVHTRLICNWLRYVFTSPIQIG